MNTTANLGKAPVRTLVGIGGSITMGIRMGEKNQKKAEQVLANSFLVLSIFSVLLTISFLLLKDKLLMWFGASGATFPFAKYLPDYLYNRYLFRTDGYRA